MNTLDTVALLCRVAAVIFALLGAYYWFKASTAKVTDKDSYLEFDPTSEIDIEDPEVKGRYIRVIATGMKQGKLNKIAAIHTGLAVLFQAAASIVG